MGGRRTLARWVQQRLVEPYILIPIRDQEAPTGRQREVWQNVRAELLSMLNVNGLEELRISRELFPAPNKPAACSALRLVS
jgi:hypothetical protein